MAKRIQAPAARHGRDRRLVTHRVPRTASSARWIARQINDPYVQAAHREGWRSRSAYKLAEIDARYKLLRSGKLVLDLGAAPGGWSQYGAARLGPGHIFAVDMLAIAPIAGVRSLMLDVNASDAVAALQDFLPRAPDVILSDMAPNTTGDRKTDHLRIVALCETALELAEQLLNREGDLVMKVWQGGTDSALLRRLRTGFTILRHLKPPASRRESPEFYVIARGRRAGA